MRSDALNRLLLLRADLAERTDESSRWLLGGVDAYLRGDAETIDQSLDLKPGHGQSSIASQFQLFLRDTHLRSAWLLIDGSKWRRSARLASDVRRFETRVWPRLRHLTDPPDSLSSIDRELFLACKHSGDTPLPGSVVGIQKAVTRTTLKPPLFSLQTKTNTCPAITQEPL